MSLRWFELPPPADLGDGWSLGFLTAAQMLESREEGEAKAQEERDKALWAGAALLARVLLKEGEPAFADGASVLEHLTVGQIEGLTRRWWAQDDFSGRAVREEWPDQERWTPQERTTAPKGWADLEQGENETFDMARFLELGGQVRERPQDIGVEGISATRPSMAAQIWPQVWPRITTAPEVPEAVQRTYRESDPTGGTVLPYRGGDAPAEVPSAVSAPERQIGMETPSRGEHSVLKVLLPETVQTETGVTVEELDKAVERDARRYDGGFTLL